MEKDKIVVPVFRKCSDCGWEQFEPEPVEVREDGRRISPGYTTCPKCEGLHLALISYKDRRVT